MRNQLFPGNPKTMKSRAERWVLIFPDAGDVYWLYDPLNERELGRILFDAADNWIYDGELLSGDEQEELAGAITGHQKEMDQLLKSL